MMSHEAHEMQQVLKDLAELKDRVLNLEGLLTRHLLEHPAPLKIPIVGETT